MVAEARGSGVGVVGSGAGVGLESALPDSVRTGKTMHREPQPSKAAVTITRRGGQTGWAPTSRAHGQGPTAGLPLASLCNISPPGHFRAF